MPVENSLLNIRPRNIPSGEHAYLGSGHLADLARANGVEVQELLEFYARQPYVSDALASFDPILVCGTGHGDVDLFTGEEMEVVWEVGQTFELAGRIVWLLSCRTGRQLGPDIVRSGAVGFGGYREDFVWAFLEGNQDADPWYEYMAKGAWRSAWAWPQALVTGLNLIQSHQASIQSYESWIDWWAESGDPNAADMIGILAWDRDALTTMGDLDATMMGGEPIPPEKLKPVMPLALSIGGTLLGGILAGLA